MQEYRSGESELGELAYASGYFCLGLSVVPRALWVTPPVPSPCRKGCGHLGIPAPES